MTDKLPRLLYRTILGRCLLKILVSPGVSCLAGKALSSRMSRRIVPWYIKKYGIKMNDIDIPPDGFSSFNDFFTRKRKGIVSPKPLDNRLLCPCDGWLSVEKIRENSSFRLKGMSYGLQRLLDDENMASLLQGGVALIFRLTPQNYHRYCYSADGKVLYGKKLEGKLHCVRPIALETVPVFAENSREYQVIRTQRQKYMVHMEIGALLVGKISNYPITKKYEEVNAGKEKGYFEFGGSTIILLFEKNTIQLNSDFLYEWDGQSEIPVQMGESIGRVLP